jgi:trafficking protein particle complex subunit 2
MAQGGSTLFVIVGRNEPLFEAEFLNKPGTAATAANNNNDTVTRQNYFVLHSALDLVEKAAWTTSNMYLRVVDKVGLFFDFSLSRGVPDYCAR